MKAAYSKPLRKEFARRMKTALPQFKQISDKSCDAECLYLWKVAPDLSFFVHLNIHDEWQEEFTLEIGWSSKGRFPIGAFRDSQKGRPSRDGEMYFRLPNLWSDHDLWWHLVMEIDALKVVILINKGGKWVEDSPDEVKARIPGLVQDAIYRLKEYGIPYFHEQAKKKGHPVPEE